MFALTFVLALCYVSSSIAFMAPGRMARRVRSDAHLSMSEDVEKPKVVLRPLFEEHNDRVAIYASVLLNPCKNMSWFRETPSDTENITLSAPTFKLPFSYRR